MKKFTPLDNMPREAASANRQFIRNWADELIALRDHCRKVKDSFPYDDLVSIAEAFVQIDDHMKGGGELPVGWSFFSQNERNGK